MGSSRYRPVCILSDKSAASLCELEARPPIRSSGCLLPPVEQGQGLCLSPILPFSQVPQSSSETAGTTSSSCSTSVENPTLVSSFIGPPYRPSSRSPSNPQSVNSGRNDSPTNPPPAGRMAFLSKLEICSQQLGEKTPQINMRLHGASGLAGVLRGKSILFQHL